MESLPGFGVPLGEFLTDRMVESTSTSKLDIHKEEKAFKDTFELLAEALDTDSFRKYEKAKSRFSGGFSVSAFEVIGLGIGWHPERFRKTHTAADVVELVKNKVWDDTSFLTSTGLAASSRLPKTLARGRS